MPHPTLFEEPLVWIAIINRDLNICRWPLILSESAPPAPARPPAAAATITPAGIEAQVNAYRHWSPHTNKYLDPRCHTAIENRHQNRKKKARTQASILLLNFHPNFPRISITMNSKRRQFFFRVFSSSSLKSSDQHLVQYLKMIPGLAGSCSRRPARPSAALPETNPLLFLPKRASPSCRRQQWRLQVVGPQAAGAADDRLAGGRFARSAMSRQGRRDREDPRFLP